MCQVTERGSGDSKGVFGVTKRRKHGVGCAFNASVQKVESDISFGRLKLWRFVADRPVCRFFHRLNRRRAADLPLTPAQDGEYIRAWRNNSPYQTCPNRSAPISPAAKARSWISCIVVIARPWRR